MKGRDGEEQYWERYYLFLSNNFRAYAKGKPKERILKRNGEYRLRENIFIMYLTNFKPQVIMTKEIEIRKLESLVKYN